MSKTTRTTTAVPATELRHLRADARRFRLLSNATFLEGTLRLRTRDNRRRKVYFEFDPDDGTGNTLEKELDGLRRS